MKHFLIGLRSLQIVFIVPFLLQIVGTVGLVGYLSFKNGEKAVEDLANDLMEEVNQLIEERIQTYLSFPPLLNQIYVDGFELGHLKLNDSRHLERYFWKQMQAFDTISFTFIGTYLGDGYGVRRQPDQTLQIVIADRSTNNRGEYYTIGDRGERLTLVGTTPKYDPRERSWYKSAVAAGQPIWSPIYIDFIEEALEATAVRPIYDENNNLIAVIGNSFLVKDIDNFLRNLEIGESGIAFLIERDNNLISTSTNTPLAIKINSELERIKATESEHPLIRKVAQELEKRWPDLSKITSSQKVEIALNGSDYFVQITPLQDEYQLNWLKIIVVPKSDFMAEINANSRTTIVLCIVALFIAIIIGILTARWVIKPILYLNHKAKSVAKGNWHETVNIQRNDELGQLANSFNSMGGQLQQFFSEITQSKQEISQILESLPVGVGVHNLDGSIIYYNEAAKSLLGKGIIENVTEKELAQTYQVYVAGTHKLYPSEKMPIIQALQGKSAWADDLEIHRQDKIITLEVSAIPIKDQHDNIIKAVAVFQDITARKQSEQILNNYQQTLETEIAQRTTELAEAKELAELANQAKSTFIANMSHELRSPLNAILGFSRLMARSQNLSPENKENAAIINRSGDYLLSLINSILDLAKIEAGKTTLNPQNFDLYRLLDEVEDMFHLRTENKGLQLIFEIEEGINRYIRTDALKLRQVLINLLNNALKFTTQGGIVVTVASQVSSNSTTNLIFSVRDTGMGIAPEEQGKVFQTFTQTQTGRQSQEGTGLGLAISRQFVQLMGGDINFTSQFGEGTIFTFNIQATLVEAIEISTSQPTNQIIALAPNQPRYRILVVDDKESNRKLLIKLLQPLGFELQEASNGLEAIEIWDEWEPHLIWMDMRMPIMDGYEATKHIKSTTKGNATAIIAITASVLEEEKQVFLSGGCDDFVRKPFQESVILDIMAKHIGVSYIYEENNTKDKQDISTQIKPEALAVMSSEWLGQFYQAAIDLDEPTMLNLIKDIPTAYSSLAQSLSELVHNFRIDKIIDLIETFKK